MTGNLLLRPRNVKFVQPYLEISKCYEDGWIDFSYLNFVHPRYLPRAVVRVHFFNVKSLSHQRRIYD